VSCSCGHAGSSGFRPRLQGEYYDNGLGDPGSYTNPYRFHPRADGAEDDGFGGFGAWEDDE